MVQKDFSMLLFLHQRTKGQSKTSILLCRQHPKLVEQEKQIGNIIVVTKLIVSPHHVVF